MVVLGDSSAAGYGVHRRRETPGALLATGLSRRLRRPVRLHRFAVVGAISAGLKFQVEAALECDPDVAVILIGGNDVTNRTPPALAVRYLVEGVRALRAGGAEVVVGTCPDLAAIRPIQPPLRWLARRWSRQLAAAQTVAVVSAGGWTVSLGDLLGPRFTAEPGRMFGWDRFHPSAEGYAALPPPCCRRCSPRWGTAANAGLRQRVSKAYGRCRRPRRRRLGIRGRRSAVRRSAAARAARPAVGRSCVGGHSSVSVRHRSPPPPSTHPQWKDSHDRADQGRLGSGAGPRRAP